jgi:4-hydroxybenzoate polyprenyltransferase
MMLRYFRLIKFSHTVFSLPFALVGYFEGVKDIKAFSWKNFILTLLALVLARTAAMAFNRWIDRDIDEKNSRTRNREIPSGKVRPHEALLLVVFSSLLFMVDTYFINKLAFCLSPVALLVVLGYSFTKRFTAWSHFVLGLGLSIAPAGAYIAATETLNIYLGWVVLSVLLWVAGFDIIYALQDEEFDKKWGLHSIPAVLGRYRAIRLAFILHVFSLFSLFFFVQCINKSLWIWVGYVLFVLLVLIQHIFVWAGYDRKIHLNFGLWNGMASVMFGGLYLFDFLMY